MPASPVLPVIFLMGPTASGKTALALDLVRKFNCDIISVDSALVYRGLDIGSAKPSAAEQALAPHRLIDICDPSESYSAGRFREDCLAAIADIHAQGRVPLLVGGTMLYFRALSQLDDLPVTDPTLRAELQSRLKSEGLSVLVDELKALDPVGAERVELKNPQRVLRALEMVRLSGLSLVELWQGKSETELPWPTLKLIVAPERTVLHQRIEQRLEKMFAQGFVKEVRELYQRADLNEQLPAIRAVGYRQVWQALDGLHDLAQAQQLALYASRQLAKRQLTWLRKEKDALWLDPTAPDFLQWVADKVSSFLANPKA